MAFKMKGYNYPGKSPIKQSYAGKNWNRAVDAKEDADNILLDPTSEGAYDIATGKTDVLKEGKHKADRVANFAGGISKLAGMAKEVKDKHNELKATNKDATIQDARDSMETDSPTQEKTDNTKEKTAEDLFSSNEGGDKKGPKIELDDETKGKLTEAGSKWASDIVGGLLGGAT